MLSRKPLRAMERVTRAVAAIGLLTGLAVLLGTFGGPAGRRAHGSDRTRGALPLLFVPNHGQAPAGVAYLVKAGPLVACFT